MSRSEEWRACPGYEGLYEISSIGRVRSLDRVVRVPAGRRAKEYSKTVSGRILALNGARSKYLTVNLNRDGVPTEHSVHVLVCAAFHGPRPPRMIVAHGDGQKHNNSKCNLRYATYRENAADSTRHGTSQRGERNSRAKLTKEDVLEIKIRLSAIPLKDIAEQYGVSVDCIRSIQLGTRWRHVTL